MAAPLAVDNSNTGSLVHLEGRDDPTIAKLFVERFELKPPKFPTKSPLYWRFRLSKRYRLFPVLENGICRLKLDHGPLATVYPVFLGTLKYDHPYPGQWQELLVDKLLKLWANNPQALLDAALDVFYSESNLSTSESPPTQSPPLQGVTFTRAPGLDIYLDSKKLDDATFQEKYDGCDRDEWSQFWEKQRKLEKAAKKAAEKEVEKEADSFPSAIAAEKNYNPSKLP
ncbi:hypothetical protein F5880DRAFT_1511880 [Lentinula raphanica]|nr:hypothetical protein F5880DRAFT_1511880 [Lentinula raphanica]